MRKVAPKRAAELREYSKLRKDFLKDRTCEVNGCRNNAVEVHHKRGRNGARLNQVEFFLGVCSNHHKLIEMNPTWAKENNYSLTR